MPTVPSIEKQYFKIIVLFLWLRYSIKGIHKLRSRRSYIHRAYKLEELLLFHFLIYYHYGDFRIVFNNENKENYITIPISIKLCRMEIKVRTPQLSIHLSLRLCDHVIVHDKTKILYLPKHITHKHQTWRSDNFS